MDSKRLGRGLDFLIPKTVDEKQNAVNSIPLRQIKRNRFQPRSDFNEEKINELALSIKENGVVQPILVRQDAGKFELIAGERRLKACKFLGLDSIPAIILEIRESQLLEFALVENLQRDDLNPIEEARAFQMFVQLQGLTHEEIAQKVGKHRTYVSNSLRLLDLPERIQESVSRGTITSGHARTLLGISNNKEILNLYETIVKRKLTVRETENIVRKTSGKSSFSKKRKNKNIKSSHITNLEASLREIFNSHVEIIKKGKKGKIVFTFHSEDDFSRLFEILSSGLKKE